MQPDDLMHEITGSVGGVGSAADPSYFHGIAIGIWSFLSSLPMHGDHLSSRLIGLDYVPTVCQLGVKPSESYCSIFTFNPIAQSNFDTTNRGQLSGLRACSRICNF